MKKSLLCLSLLFVCLTPCAAQRASGPFADVPLGTAPYADMAMLERSGITIGPAEGTYTGRRVMSRFQFAALAAPLLKQLSEMPNHSDFNPKMPLLASPSALAALQDLSLRFQPELARLGVNVSVVQSRLTALKQAALRPLAAGPFPDVPKDHWAAAAVETLRQRGIVVGYPASK